jgi:hypothetical protein
MLRNYLEKILFAVEPDFAAAHAVRPAKARLNSTNEMSVLSSLSSD